MSIQKYPVSFRLTEEYNTAFNKIADDSGMSKTKTFNLIVRQWIDLKSSEYADQAHKAGVLYELLKDHKDIDSAQISKAKNDEVFYNGKAKYLLEIGNTLDPIGSIEIGDAITGEIHKVIE